MTPTELNTSGAQTGEPGHGHTHDHDHEHNHAHTQESADDNPLLREVEVTIPAEVVQRESENFVSRYQKLARVPGFRKGKVPASIIRRRFADELKSEVVESLIPKYFREEVQKQGLQPITQPRVVDLHLHESEPLRFKARFEVMPAIELTGIDEVSVEKPDLAVTDDEVNAAINNLREQHATYTNIEDRELRDGDFASISFTGTATEEGAEPITMDDILAEIGGDNTVKEFSDNLRGATVGDTREFQVSYPAEYADQRLANKTINYAVTVKAIKQKQTPELNDDFAKQAGEFETFAALKQRVREQLESEKKHSGEHIAKEKLLDELIARNQFAVPTALLESQIDQRLERGMRALAAQGMRIEDMRKMDFGRLRQGQREAALREVRASLLLDKVAEKENIEVSDEEVDREIQMLALQSRQPVESLRTRLAQDGTIENIKNRIRNEKALDYLYQRPA